MTEQEIINKAKNVFDEEISSLNIVKNNINQSFVEAVKIIANAKKVFLCGVGKSGLVGRKISATFASIGIPSFFIHPVEALHGDIGFADKGDTIILLSKSGSTDEIIRLVPHLKSKELSIIAIIGDMNSYLYRNADIVLDSTVLKEACPFNLVPTSSTMAQLAIGDALAVCVMLFNNISIQDFSRNHPLGQIGRNITLKVKDLMHQNEFLPSVKYNADFKDAIIEITNKNLGCVCIVDDNFILKGLITDGDIRRTLQNYDDIRKLSISDVMTKNPITISEDVFLANALDLMENKGEISVLPVCDSNNKCIGVIRIHDIIQNGV